MASKAREGSGKLMRRPDEYPTARNLIAEPLVKGTTPTAIANMLNREGIRTRHGKYWTAQGIVNLAHSAAWAGLIADRERQTDEFGNPLDKYHRGGTPRLDKHGHPISCGEGVVTFAERGDDPLAHLRRKGSRPGTTIGDRTRGKRAPATIATGILRCPHCKGPMGNGGRNYRCLARINRGTAVCEGVATSRQRVDDALAPMWQRHILSLPPDSGHHSRDCPAMAELPGPRERGTKGCCLGSSR